MLGAGAPHVKLNNRFFATKLQDRVKMSLNLIHRADRVD